MVTPGMTLGAQTIGIAGNGDFGGVDLSNVTGISFIFNGNDSTDITLGDVGITLDDGPDPVPEPASVAVWTLMALGSVFFASRLRKKLAIARR